jgi:hypothetical protein
MTDITLCASNDCDKRKDCVRAQKYPAVEHETRAYCDFLNHVPPHSMVCPWFLSVDDEVWHD